MRGLVLAAAALLLAPAGAAAHGGPFSTFPTLTGLDPLPAAAPDLVPSRTFASTGHAAVEPTIGVAPDGTLHYVGIEAKGVPNEDRLGFFVEAITVNREEHSE